MSARVAGTTPFRPNPSYTTLRDVTGLGSADEMDGLVGGSTDVLPDDDDRITKRHDLDHTSRAFPI